ncbi:MAG: YjbE family putative metal transport protein [Bacillota bacterium]
MDTLLAFILPILQITMLDIILSGDNVGVIALAIRNIEPKRAKIVSAIGISGAIIIRIVFASIITVIMKIDWLPIRLIGGILLIKITWDLINQGLCDSTEECHVKSENTFWKAIISIVIADVSMGLDNVLAIAGSADGNVSLIIYGILLNIPIIFFGSQFVAKLMNKYRITIFIGGAILMHTALAMIMEDKLIVPYISHILAIIVPWIIAAGILVYGLFKLRALEAGKMGVQVRN